MLKTLKTFFDQHFSTETSGQDKDTQLKLAKAALLTEVCYADHNISSEEENRLKAILLNTFNIEKEIAEELITLAKTEVQEGHSTYQFTRLINEHFNAEQKYLLVKAMWEIAYADNELDHYEEAMIRKLADLLYVPHKDFIQAKLAVQDSL